MNIEKLFRKEAREHNQISIEGSVIVLPPSNFRNFALLLFILVGSFFVFLITNTYSLKEKVRGIVYPNSGVVEVKAPRSGTIDELYVSFDDDIAKDQLLFSISNEKSLTSQQELIASESIKIQEQLHNLRMIVNTREEFRVEEVSFIRKKIKNLKQLRVNTKEKFNIVSEQIIRNDAQLKSLLALKEKGLYSEFNIVDRRNENSSKVVQLLDIKERLKSLDINIEEAEYSLNSALFDEEQLSLRNRILALETSLQKLKYEEKLVVRASDKGTIASINTNRGEHVDKGDVLLKLLPKNSELEVILYIPTRASGFVAVGQNVNIRYDAFPYQKFGFFSGKITEVQDFLLFPQEIETPGLATEPVYKAIVKLDSSAVKAFSKSFSLRPGMTLEADIIMYERTFLEWLFSPLFNLKGTL